MGVRGWLRGRRGRLLDVRVVRVPPFVCVMLECSWLEALENSRMLVSLKLQGCRIRTFHKRDEARNKLLVNTRIRGKLGGSEHLESLSLGSQKLEVGGTHLHRLENLVKRLDVQA